jgi:hypothetical protein
MNGAVVFILALAMVVGALALFGALARRSAKPGRANRSAARAGRDEGVLLI